MTTTVSIPFEGKPPDVPRTDALVDLHIRVAQALNFCGGILYLFGQASPESFKRGAIRVEWRSPLHAHRPVIEVHLTQEGLASLPHVLPDQLFTAGVIQLAAAFETYVAEVLADVFLNNDALVANSDRPLSAAEVFDFGSLEKLKHHLIEDTIAKYLAKSYPHMVERFERQLHVGLHSKRSPVPLPEAHHFFEVRNIVVHNEGRASPQYLDRMKPYADAPPAGCLAKKGDSFPIDYSWLFDQGHMLLKLGVFADQEITSKWRTTASPEGMPAMFWYRGDE